MIDLTYSLSYCLRCNVRAIVDWIPGWEWHEGSIGCIIFDDRPAKFWTSLIEDRNLLSRVERKIAESEEFSWRYISKLYGVIDREEIEKPFQKMMGVRRAAPEDCIKAFGKTSSIQSILEEMEYD